LAMAMTKGAASASTLALIKGVLNAMAWTKAKTALTVGIFVLLVAGTATVTIQKIGDAHANTYAWRSANIDLLKLEQLPPEVRILPSTFSENRRRGLRGPGNGSERKMIGLGFGAASVFASAWGRTDARIVFDAPQPTNHYDFVCTLPSGQGAALQNELRKELGLEGKIERRDADVFRLVLTQPNAAGLRRSVNARASLSSNPRRLSGTNVAFDLLANELEMRLGIPVVNETGLTNQRFDFELTWEQPEGRLNVDGLKRALLDQLGLELVPARQSVEMVVVNKGAQ